jgi:ABC-type branched-subunit amino acid transport system substrate-binding protein
MRSLTVFALCLVSGGGRKIPRCRPCGSLLRVLFCLVSAFVWVATASFGADAETPNVSAGSATEKVASISVGLALPLSGESARYGLDIQRGALMATEELQKRGIELVLISEDTQLLPRVAATAAQKLISRDHVNVVVSLWDTAEAVAPIAEQRKTPHISIRWNHRVAQEFPHTFTFESTYVTWVRATLDFLRSKGVKRLAVMTDESGAGWVFARE